VVLALRAFRPELIVVPSGFDGSMYDPLGRMMAYSETYRAMTRMLMAAADELCGGRLVLCLEGGYNLEALGASVAETIRVLTR